MGDSENTTNTTRPKIASRASVRASLLMQAGRSFIRSKGERGASVETLRGNTGADFEGKAKLHRGSGAPVVGCGCFGGGSNGSKEKFILIKGPFCFVFDNDKSQAPKYAISLSHMKAELESETSVTIQTSLGDVEYEFFFTEAAIAQNFQAVVADQAAAAETEEIRKKLGHAHLLTKRSSLRFAEKIAQKKVEEQPEAPVSTEDVMANLPVLNNAI